MLIILLSFEFPGSRNNDQIPLIPKHFEELLACG